ncbi:hypothetical protein A3376_25130 [Escherichia coli]|nr:hypothetical protein [Escherichia coli]
MTLLDKLCEQYGADRYAVALSTITIVSKGRMEGTREQVIHLHAVLVYEVDSQWGKVYILHVLHTAQK